MSVNMKDSSNTLNVFSLPPLPTLNLPPLPPISNPALRSMVFTHTSTGTLPRSHNTSYLLVDGDAGMDYEKLEHVGDAILEAVAVTMVHELYPNLRQGAASSVRDRLVCNVTLAQIALAYGLQRDLVTHPTMRHNLKRNEKVQASIFEAYIAGVYYSFIGQIPGHSKSSSSSSSVVTEGVKEAPEIGNCKEGSDAQDHQPTHQCTSESQNSNTADAPDETRPDQDVEFNTKVVASDAIPDRQSDDADDDHTIGAELLRLALTRAEEPATDSGSITDGDEDVDEGKDNSIDPNSPQATSSSDTIKPERTRGDAFDHVFSWLSQVLEPVTHFIIETYKVEEKRLSEMKRNPYRNLNVPAEWIEEDQKALGARVVLHEHYTVEGRPTYTYVRDETYRHPESNPWRCHCLVKDCGGKEWRAEAVRMTKQAASNVAAWKICVQMGLLNEDEC